METEYEKYVCDKNTLKQTLEEYGVAIIPNVINEIECEEMRDGMWSFF
jgi:heterodisulfide reductase subunit A-like polyferredoxin